MTARLYHELTSYRPGDDFPAKPAEHELVIQDFVANDFARWPAPCKAYAQDLRADLVLTNESPRPRRVCLTMRLVPAVAEPAPLRIESPLWDEELTIGPKGQTISRTLEVPAGSRPRIRFHCRGRPRQDASDPRPVVFRIGNVKLVEAGE